MKKLIALTVIALAAVASNAASVDWKITAGNMYASDGTTKYTGTFNLYATGGDLTADTLVYTLDAVSAGTIANKTITTTSLTVGESYSFYFVLEDGGKAFTSDVKAGLTAAATGATPVNFGNMQSATQNASNWAAVPEPTSGLLLLLGMAGLALKRKRA